MRRYEKHLASIWGKCKGWIMALVHMEMLCAGGTELPLKCVFHFSVTLILHRLFAETTETMKEVKKIPRGKFVSASVTVFPSYSSLFL